MKRVNQITAVSEESPSNFHVSNGMVLSQKSKNERFSPVGYEFRFLNRLKKNNVYDKPFFDYSDIKQQAFDYHSINPSKALDLSFGVSPGLRSLTPFNSKYSKHLQNGFGKRRGQFTVEASQSKVNRLGLNEFQFLSTKQFKFSKVAKAEKQQKRVLLAELLNKPEKTTKKTHSSEPKFKKTLKQIEEFELNLAKLNQSSKETLSSHKHFYDFK